MDFVARTRAWLSVLVLLAVAAPFGAAQAGSLSAVPTFESLGIYWKGNPPPAGSDSATLLYRRSGQGDWKRGLPLWYDARDHEYRGSIVELVAGAAYDVRVIGIDGSKETITTKTWSNTFPVARTVTLPATSDSTLKITQGGSPSGWVVYTGPAGTNAVIDVAKQADNDILVLAPYVIIRNVVLKGAKKSAIVLGTTGQKDAGVTDVVIEGSDISGWGTPATSDPRWGNNREAAIFSGATDLARIVVQRNKMHHPSTDTNSWEEDNNGFHPKGPQPITFLAPKGNLVIRYNEIYSDANHYFNDGMGAANNFSDGGFPNRDSDIYGNFIANTWDDGIEAEGANRNVRIWNNYVDHVYVPMGVAPIYGGPFYVWRNVSNTVSSGPANSITSSFFKMRNVDDSGVNWGGGRAYLFNNTALKPQDGSTGVRNFLKEFDDDNAMTNVRSLNNLMSIDRPSAGYSIKVTHGVNNQLDYDLFDGKVEFTAGQEGHGAAAAPVLRTGWGLNRTSLKGIFSLTPGTPGYDAGVAIPNFTANAKGYAPDMGAHEAGAAAMEFGVKAHLAK